MAGSSLCLGGVEGTESPAGSGLRVTVSCLLWVRGRLWSPCPLPAGSAVVSLLREEEVCFWGEALAQAHRMSGLKQAVCPSI